MHQADSLSFWDLTVVGVIGSTGQLSVVEGLVTLVGEEQWTINLPWLQPVTNSVIHVSVSKHR